MEEADQLSDRIVFLKNGEVRCIGSSYALKDEFAKGLDLSVIVKEAKTVERVIDFVMRRVSGLKVKFVLDKKIDFEFKRSQAEKVNELLKLLLKESELKNLIEDWGITNSTLEDVFFNLHNKD